jgi:hypothetical protein
MFCTSCRFRIASTYIAAHEILYAYYYHCFVGPHVSLILGSRRSGKTHRVIYVALSLVSSAVQYHCKQY